MRRTTIWAGLSALTLVTGLVLPAALATAPASAATASSEYIALEVAKVPGAFHVVVGAGTTANAAETSAHNACASYLAAAGKVFNGEDCNTAAYVQYGYVAESYANPGATTANGYAWGFGWGHTKAAAISGAQSDCGYYNGKACPYGGWAVTPNYAGAQVTTGGYINNPLVDAVNWALDNESTNPLTGNNWITPVSACEQMVEEAYGTKYIYGTSAADYTAQKNADRINTDVNAPRGALVFFVGADPSSGHVGLAYGNGADYYTVDGGTIHEAPLSEGLGYEGWSYAPADWPGR
jgi:hypothetical protein